MVQFDTGTEETALTTDESGDRDATWLTLQRVVAGGMLVVLATPMVVVLQRFIPPLAIASVLFAIALGLT